MPQRFSATPRPRTGAAAALAAAAVLAAGVAPAQADSLPATSQPAAVKQARPAAAAAKKPADVSMGALTSAALAHPLPGMSLAAFAAAPALVEKAKAEEAKAAKIAAAKKAAAKKAAEKKAAAKKAAAKKKADAAREEALDRSSRSGARATGDPRSIARSMVAKRGWGSEQFGCLDKLWNKESNWLPTAKNPSSSAYGIPQSLPGSKMASAGADWRTNPATQITWGLGYIADRYGSPCSAWAHSRAHNWY